MRWLAQLGLVLRRGFSTNSEEAVPTTPRFFLVCWHGLSSLSEWESSTVSESVASWSVFYREWMYHVCCRAAKKLLCKIVIDSYVLWYSCNCLASNTRLPQVFRVTILWHSLDRHKNWLTASPASLYTNVYVNNYCILQLTHLQTLFENCKENEHTTCWKFSVWCWDSLAIHKTVLRLPHERNSPKMWL